MTDRELLIAAAKAAGIVLFTGGSDVRVPEECHARLWQDRTILFFHGSGHPFDIAKRGKKTGNIEWNPLLDDGDALRLAVRLRLQIVTSGVSVVQAIDYGTPSHAAYGEAPVGDDRCAATRRAIVRAAASLATEATQNDR